MTDLLDAGWTVDASWPWLLLALPITWITRATYRRTRPGVAPPTERALWVLRVAALSILILVLSEPLLTYLARHAQRPTVVALVDTSPSMLVVENGLTRLDRARQALEGELGRHLAGASVRGFAGQPYAVSPDTLSRITPGGQSTDLAAALASVGDAIHDDRLVGGVVLLSDGRHNLGEDPVAIARDLGVPVFALGVGSGEPAADVQLLSVAAPKSAFAGRPLALQIALRSWGYDGVPAELTATTQELQLARSSVHLGSDGQVHSTTIEVPPLSPGPHILRVAVTEMGGELSLQNNQRLVFLHVRQDRLRVLLVANAPGTEVGFLQRALRGDSTLAVTALIRRDERSFYGAGLLPEQLTDFDALVLVDPQVGLIDAIGVERIEAFLRSGRGLLVVGGIRSGDPLASLLPVVVAPSSAMDPAMDPTDTPIEVAPSGLEHPLGRFLASQEEASDGSWRRLPPLSGRVRGLRLADGARVLLQTSSGDPVVVAGSTGPGRVLAAMGTGFWRLDLHGAGLGEGAHGVRSFWQAAARWLAAASSSGRVRSSPERPVYRAGEPATVIAEVYDELNEPIGAARVSIAVSPGVGETVMEPVGAGRFLATVTGLEPGEYTYLVEVHHQDQPLGRSQGRFVVESHSIEAMDLRADPDLLADIAANSGGDYRPLTRWRELEDRLRPPPRLVREEERLGIDVDQQLWLILSVALLSAEWLIRKRAGML